MTHDTVLAFYDELGFELIDFVPMPPYPMMMDTFLKVSTRISYLIYMTIMTPSNGALPYMILTNYKN